MIAIQIRLATLSDRQ